MDTAATTRREAGDFRELTGAQAVAVNATAAVSGVFLVAYLGGAVGYFRFFLYENQYNAVFLAIVLALTFVLVPAGPRAPRDRVPWYDVLFAAAGVAGCAYIVVNAHELAYFGRITATPVEIALGAATIVTLMEAVRRSFGWAMVVIASAFILYAKLGYLAPGILRLYYFDWSMLTSDIYLGTSGIFGTLTSVASGIIVAFIMFGVFFVAAGGGRFFLDLTLALTGGMRGGPAKAAIFGSALFGTVSGSPAANVVVTGSVTIPMMRSVGYQPYYAGAIEAIASTGGALAPPIMSGVAFVMAMMVGKPYAYIATISALPALLYFMSLYVQVHLHAKKENIRGLPREQLPTFWATLRGGWELVLPFVVLCLLLFVLRYPPEMAALYTIGALVVTSLFRRVHRLGPQRIVQALADGVRATLAIANIIALAGIILAVLTVTGLGPRLSAALVTAAAGNVYVLVILAGLACYVLGMGISFIAAYILVAALVAPALLELGLPLVASHFFIMYMVLATNFTPPYCTAAYVAAGIARAHPFAIGFQAMRLGVVCFLVPFVVVFNPALILIGSTGEILLAAVTAIVGIAGLSAGIEGYLFVRASWMQRLLFVTGGVGMFVPGVASDVAGVMLLAIATAWQAYDARRAPAVSPATAERPVNEVRSVTR